MSSTDARGLSATGAPCGTWTCVRPRSSDAPVPTSPLGEGPNQRLARATMAQEVRRLAISPPATSAICCQAGGRTSTVGNRTRIHGNGTNALGLRRQHSGTSQPRAAPS